MRFKQGAEELSTRLADALPAGSVKFGVQVTGVHVQGDSVLVVAAGPAGDALVFPAQAVIVALPPRLAEQTITFMPELPPALTQVLSATPTWMGHAMKAVVRYERAFWRAQGLSGFAVSYTGPLQEIHDASPADGGAGALFGFFTAHAEVRRAPRQERQHLVMEQLGRLFGPAALLPRSYDEVDWTRERLSSTAQDEAPPKVFPAYGHTLLREPALDGRLFWAGAETSPLEGGLLEGAVQSGEHAARLVLAGHTAQR
ncbi:flavin monoamine oxidase family protein [Deinococcus malanensis]|uniref:flavin monoamine oxidase family protein n=1 Tax=Deinococcus malanensis TaxID=1706855 RepID=UPI00363C587C